MTIYTRRAPGTARRERRGRFASPARDSHDWIVVLAGGHGRRMRHLTRTADGIAVPKQYCGLGRGPSLLHAALQRARVLAPPERILITVTREHRRWWRGLSAEVPVSNILIEPRQRGTGIGILRALVEIVRRDPHAFISLLPSDHFFANEAAIATGLLEAVRQARRFPRELLLVGFEPTDCDADLGYVLTGEARAGEPGHVRRFIEKPDAALAASLVADGALLNSFILVGAARTLLRLFEARFPAVVRRLRTFAALDSAARTAQLSRLFRALPDIDFSRDIMTADATRLRVLRLGACGWSDLGTPARLERVLRRHAVAIDAMRPAPPGRGGVVDLSRHRPAPRFDLEPRRHAAA